MAHIEGQAPPRTVWSAEPKPTPRKTLKYLVKSAGLTVDDNQVDDEMLDVVTQAIQQLLADRVAADLATHYRDLAAKADDRDLREGYLAKAAELTRTRSAA